MTGDDIRAMFAYNGWATLQLLQAVQRVPVAEFTRGLDTSHHSLRGTLVHLVWSEWIWLQRWLGHSPRQRFSEDAFSNASAIAERAQAVQRDRAAFLATLTDADLNRRIAYENLEGERWEYTLAQMVQHVLHHSSYHRGQVASLLRQLGHTPPSTDFLVFVDLGGESA